MRHEVIVGVERRREWPDDLKLSILYDIWQAETRVDAGATFDFFVTTYGVKYDKLVAQGGDITLLELAGALEAATGVVAHSAFIGRFLRKLGYTYKRSHPLSAAWLCHAPAG